MIRHLNGIRRVGCACVLLLLPLIVVACTETRDLISKASLSIAIVQQPTGGDDPTELTCTLRVNRLVPAPGAAFDPYAYRVIRIQVNWYSGLSPLQGSGDFRRSNTFDYLVTDGESVTYTAEYDYPYYDPLGAQMEGYALILWEDATGSHEVRTAPVFFQSSI